MSSIRPHSAPCNCDATADIDYDVLEELEKGFTRLRLSNATTFLRKFLSKRVFRLLECERTELGATLLDCIRVGLRHHDAPIGAYASDQSAYDAYKFIFDPLIKKLHFRFDFTDKHPESNWGDWSRIENLDPDDKYIVSTRVRCSRNLNGYRFTPTMSPCEFEEVETAVMRLLQKLPGEYKGTYIPLRNISHRRQKELELDHCFFPEGTKFERTANITRFWPAGRGIYVNQDRNFAVWVNEKDHMRVICLDDGGDLHSAYRRLAAIMPVLERRLTPAHHPRLGYLTVSPSNVGTALRLSVFMKLPHSPVEEVNKIAKIYHIDVICLCGVQESFYCMSNMRRLGYTEYALTREFNLGIRELINLEKHHEMLTPTGLKNSYNINNNNNNNDDDYDDDNNNNNKAKKKKKSDNWILLMNKPRKSRKSRKSNKPNKPNKPNSAGDA